MQPSAGGGPASDNHLSLEELQGEEADAPVIPLKPLPTIYDKEVDPPGYDEETTEHPHHRLYPTRLEDFPNKSVLEHGWRIIGASRRGYGHAYQGKYREDDLAINIYRFSSKGRPGNLDFALIAIADGVSSKEHSRYGALAAVQGAANLPRWSELLGTDETAQKLLPQEQLRALASRLAFGGYDNECRNLAYHLLMEAIRAAMMSVIRRAQQEDVANIDDLHSTLMVILAAPLDQQRLFVASVQVGDGVLFALREDGSPRLRDRWTWVQHAQIQTSGNEVQPLMRSNPDVWEEYFQCDVLDNTIFVMGMTDGTADDIEPPRPTPEEQDPDPFIHVDDFYQQIRRDVIGAANPAQALDDFLGYRKRQSYDDRTVVCLYNEQLQ